MKKQFMRALLCLGLLLPLGAKAEIFVFGDSLSDTGNAAVLADAGPFLEEFDNGRLKRELLRFLTDPDEERVALCFPGVTFVEDTMPPEIKDVDPDFPCEDLFFMSSRVSNGPVAVEVLAKRLGFEDLQPSLHFWDLVGLPQLGAAVGVELPRPFVGTNYAVAAGRQLEDLASETTSRLK